MPLGKPFSHVCGVLQGRSDAFSDSVLAHPPEATAARTSSRRTAQRGLEIAALTRQDGQE
jgi:hypothetical protein